MNAVARSNNRFLSLNFSSMNIVPTQFVTDAKGKRVSVILPVEVYDQMLEILDDLDDVQLYDQAKTQPSDMISAEDAFSALDKQHQS